MASNPLDDNDPALRDRIEKRAYHLWQADGEPHGRHDEYWERARELVNMELSGPTGQLPNPATLPGADPNAPDNVEEAFIQENLGEFPDRFADQGEKTATPRAKAGARPRRRPEIEAAPATAQTVEEPEPEAAPAVAKADEKPRSAPKKAAAPKAKA